MASEKRCCVTNCITSRSEDKIILHYFPNPHKEADRFRSWIYCIGGDILALDNQVIYKHRRVCHKHFETKYLTRSSRLTVDAVPTLQLKGPSRKRPMLEDITNLTSNDPTVAEPSTSSFMGSSCKRPMSDFTNLISNNPTAAEPSTPTDSVVPEKAAPKLSQKQGAATDKQDSVVSEKAAPKLSQKKRAARDKQVPTTARLERTIKRLQEKKDSYATRLKKALKLSENSTFLKCLQKFTTLAAIFTVMQFRELSKRKMGRRFTKEEKIMALSLYKLGPKAYRWLSKIFILPSPVTLSRLISTAGLRPGLNKKIFLQLKKRAQSMTENEKLCILLFDEISLTPHYDYSRKRDGITGFVTNGSKTKREIADHALVFMLRGVLKNYKQPLSYTFCKGTTSKEDLKFLIKNIIKELQECGLKVLATVCDQGTTNVSTINKLIEETRGEYIKRKQEFKHDIFEVNGEEIIPLYDPPHLIKGIRNNLINQNLKCTIDDEIKIGKWVHIRKLHEENPAYKGIRLIKNLTEAHVDPRKISKMKVKLATQIFSKTVASNMGYLAGTAYQN